MLETAATGERPLRIAHFIGRCDADSANGVERMVHDLTLAQAALGHHVARLILHPAGDEGPVPLESTLRRRCGAVIGIGALLLGRAIPKRVWDELIAWQPDLVHLHSVFVPENVALGKRLRRVGIPYCVTVHGALAPQARRHGRLKKALFHAAYERSYLESASAVHALTSDEEQQIRRSGIRTRVVVAPNGVDAGAGVAAHGREALLQRFPTLGARRVFMFIGRLDPVQKGLDLLLEAFAGAALHDAALVLIGPDWRGGRSRLERLVRALGLSECVLFDGPVFGGAKQQLLRGADVFVHTSRWEGVSLSVLEAGAAGLPCLLTPDADPSGHFGRAGAAVVAEGTQTALTGALRQLAAMSTAELRSMGDRGRATIAAHFTWPAVARTVVDFYRAGVVR